MKQVFNTNEVAHIWAQQSQNKGRNQGGNFYFEGKTIYSYGSHFPIATIEGGDVLFTTRRYSNTTAKHIQKALAAISHLNKIDCFEVPGPYWGNDKPLNKQSFTSVHESNITQWKSKIVGLFAELGNKKNRDVSGRIGAINSYIADLTKYCDYFGVKVRDKELRGLIKTASQPDFLELARASNEKQAAAKAAKMKQAAKAFNQYVELWRNYDKDGIENIPEKDKVLIRFYEHNQQFTRLRFNTGQNRVETSKGVQIPAEIAKRAYLALNGCMAQSCNGLSIPVLEYTITETGKDYIKAGCHTIPKADIQYIANLLNW